MTGMGWDGERRGGGEERGREEGKESGAERSGLN